MNLLLYGHDPEERIVAVHHHDDNTMRVFVRSADGVQFRDERFFPFLFLRDQDSLPEFHAKHWLKRLEGDSYFRYACAFEGWSALWDAVRLILEAHNRQSLTKVARYSSLESLFLVADPITQYLLQSGKTVFKGMQFDDLTRLQLDIETYASRPSSFSSASREGDRIILIALSDNRGWEHLVDGSNLSEQDMLMETVRLINERDPDVIEGHNIYEFDLPYILKRCELNHVSFGIGRDGSTPYSPFGRTQNSGGTKSLPITEVAGRHIVDTLVLVRNYDLAKRTMEGHGLKYSAQFFGLAPPDRTYIKPERISWHWDNEPGPLKRYAMDDVLETRALSDLLLGTYFHLGQMLPMAFSSIIRSGAAVKIENLLLREYLRARHSVPKASTGFQTTGGYTDIFAVGILGPVLHVDIESLYPSIMIMRNFRPSSDVLAVFPRLLGDLTALRIETKRSMNAEHNGRTRAKLDAMQSSLKILINSFYGYLGYARGLFNDYEKASEVTLAGQRLLRTIMEEIRSNGGTVIEVDTDGIFFVPPKNVVSREEERRFVQMVARVLPEGIHLTLDGRYRKMLSYKKKNYALLDHEGNIRIKGSSLTSRSIERFGRDFIRTCISRMLENDIEGLHGAYIEIRERIQEHKLELKEFVRIEALGETLAEYRQSVDTGRRARSAAYEVALAMDRPFKRGERVAFYVTGDDPNPRSFQNCKPAAEWNPNFPDENVGYYLRRLDEFAEKFLAFFTPQDHRRIFSPDDLFPFSPDGLAILPPQIPSKTSDEEDAGPSPND